MVNGYLAPLVDAGAFCARDPFNLPFSADRSFELRDGSEHPEHQLAAGRACVHASLLGTLKVDALGDEACYDVMQVDRRPRKPVQARNNERIALSAKVDGRSQLRATGRVAGQLLGKDSFGTGRSQRILLYIQRLIGRTNPGVAYDHPLSPLALDFLVLLSCEPESDLKETGRASWGNVSIGITRSKRATDRRPKMAAIAIINNGEAAGLERLPLRQRTLRLSKGENRARCAIRARAAGSNLWSKQ
jgi:hypothetical protein